LADLVETSTGSSIVEHSPAVIGLSILVFFEAGMRAGARSRRPAETTASGDRPKGTANGGELSLGRQVSGMAHTTSRNPHPPQVCLSP